MATADSIVLPNSLMNPDDPVCLCFHVTRRKVVKFIRIEKPRRAGQLSECFGAGTGCGWCRPYLERLFQQHSEYADPARADQHGQLNQIASLDELTLDDYQSARQQYRQQQQSANEEQPEPEKQQNPRFFGH